MLTPVDETSLLYVCLRLRERDAREIYNLRPHDNPVRLASEAAWVLPQGRARIAWYQGRPAGVVGMFESWPRMWEMVMFGTDEFPHVAFAMMRWARRELRDLLVNGWGHRLQADSHVEHEEAHKFIRAMGGREEVRLLKYGKDGSEYVRFSWVAGVNDHVAMGRASV